MSLKATKSLFVFQGIEVSSDEVDACGAVCGPHVCTRLKKHQGEHIAHLFHDRNGRPAEVSAVFLMGKDDSGWGATWRKSYHWYENELPICGVVAPLEEVSHRLTSIHEMSVHSLCRRCLKMLERQYKKS